MANPFKSIITDTYHSLADTAMGWFTPSKPIDPSAPPGTQPRSIEYPPGYNLNIMPRAFEDIDFQSLRTLAENCDILRAGLETCKDQIEILEFGFGPIKRQNWKPADIKAATDRNKGNIDKAYKLFAKPDPVNGLSWARWVRKWLEDMMVIDALSIEIIRNRGGDVCRLKIVDGATINVKIDINGDRPQPPDPAYQQILYGLPAVNLTTDQLIYLPRNQRPGHVYGYGYVEQIVDTIDIAIRRQLYTIGFFTEGSIPETVFTCPPEWQVEQIKAFQTYWDMMFEGNQNLKRKGRWIPGGVKPEVLKQPQLVSEFDEWIARVVMYVLSLPPTPFVKQMNRATAETVQEAASNEGNAPRKKFVKEVVDLILQHYCGWDEIELQWVDAEAVSPLEKAQIDQIYVTTKVLDPDEVREDLGRDPLTPEQYAKLNPPPPAAITGGEVDENGKPVPPSKKAPAAQPQGTKEPVDEPTAKLDNLVQLEVLADMVADRIAKKAVKKKSLIRSPEQTTY